MTAPHADRDHSERPWTAPDLDEPIPFALTDEPIGERVRWPLDEGDTGEPLLRGDS